MEGAFSPKELGPPKNGGISQKVWGGVKSPFKVASWLIGHLCKISASNSFKAA